MNGFSGRLRVALLTGRRANVRGFGIVAPRRSDGYEFAELRAYVQGDDPRRIDWAATARAGALQSRVMLEDAALVLAAVIDTSASMAVGRNQSNYDAACAVARVWYDAAVDDDRCARVGERVLTLPSMRGRAAAAACAGVREPLGASFTDTLQLAYVALPRGAKLLMVSDFYEGAVVEAVQACAAKFDVTALVVRDPWHADLPLGGFVRFRDAETGRLARVYVDRGARARYRSAVERRESRLLQALRDAGARSALLDAKRSPEAVLGDVFGIL